MNRWASLSLTLVALTALLVGPIPLLALLPLGLALVHLALQRVVKLSAGSEFMLGLSLFALCVVIGVNVDLMPAPIGDAPIPRGWATFGYALLVLAALRLWIEAPRGGASLTLGLALVSFAVWGGKNSGLFYPLAIVSFLASAALAMRAADPGRPRLRALGRRHVSQIAAALVLALTSASVAALTLPPLHSWVVERVMRGLPKKSGFTSFMWLGSMKGMLQSDRIVMRVRGAKTNYLRGILYVEYTRGAWTRRSDEHQVRPVPRTLPPASGVTEIEIVRDGPRYFTPLETNELAASTGFVTFDDGGIYEPVAGDPAKRLWFNTWKTPPKSPRTPAREFPVDMELTLPGRLVAPLQRLARSWTQGVDSPRKKLEALALHLRAEYTYSLDFERPDHEDPVIDFLLHTKRGHCEYFASALALLARSIGIPSRVVAGYTVSEFSDVGGYYLVRERNAHSWVEAWTGD
ncbi:MAG: transglutaminaseTgpA domain-containing protein, partial [Polyangiaceae bacterium]